MKHQLEIKFIVGPGFAPALSAKSPARSSQPPQTVLVILPDGKVVRRAHPLTEAALPSGREAFAPVRKTLPASARPAAMPRRLFLSVRQVRPASAPISSRN